MENDTVKLKRLVSKYYSKAIIVCLLYSNSNAITIYLFFEYGINQISKIQNFCNKVKIMLLMAKAFLYRKIVMNIFWRRFS